MSVGSIFGRLAASYTTQTTTLPVLMLFYLVLTCLLVLPVAIYLSWEAIERKIIKAIVIWAIETRVFRGRHLPQHETVTIGSLKVPCGCAYMCPWTALNTCPYTCPRTCPHTCRVYAHVHTHIHACVEVRPLAGVIEVRDLKISNSNEHGSTWQSPHAVYVKSGVLRYFSNTDMLSNLYVLTYS